MNNTPESFITPSSSTPAHEPVPLPELSPDTMPPALASAATIPPLPVPSMLALADFPTVMPAGDRAPDANLIPEIPGYRIDRELGRGGMGVVFQGHQLRLNRPVALKMILAGNFADSQSRTRFLGEAEVMAKLRHVHIAQIYECGQFEEKPYFAMEYLEAGSLDKFLKSTPQTPEFCAALIERLAYGVQAAHEQGIVHRDLKPANVLLDFVKEGSNSKSHPSGVNASGQAVAGVIPKITDFGLAKLTNSELTASGAVLGSPSYMSPEQAAGKGKEIGPASDIYSLGAILYECLTGRPPFKAATPLDTILQVVEQDPVSIRQLQPKTPLDIETICLKCLQKEPGKRYTSAQALADDLRRYLHGEPILARPVSVVERSVKWVKRNRIITGAAISILFVLALGLAASLWEMRRAMIAEEEAREAQADAMYANDLGKKLLLETVQAKEKASEMLSRQYSMNASRALDDGDTGSATLWTAKALQAIEGSEEKERPLRVQFNELLRNQPRPVATWEAELYRFPSRKGKLISNDGRILFIPKPDGIMVYNLVKSQMLQSPVIPKNTTVVDAIMTEDGKRGFMLVAPNNTLPMSFILSYSFTPFGMPLAHAVQDISETSTLLCWDIDTGKILYQLAGLDLLHCYPRHFELSKNQKRLFIGRLLLDVATGRTLYCLPEVKEYARAILNDTGTKVVITHRLGPYHEERGLTLFDCSKLASLPKSCHYSGKIHRIWFHHHADEQLLVLSENSKHEVSLTELQNNITLAGPHGEIVNAEARHVSHTDIDMTSMKLAIGYGSNSIRLIDIVNNKLICRLGSDRVSARHFTFGTPGSNCLTVALENDHVSVYDANTGKQASEFWQCTDSIEWIKFDTIGNHFLVGSNSGVVYLLRAEISHYSDDGLACILALDKTLPHFGTTDFVDSSKDERHKVTVGTTPGSHGSQLTLWDFSLLEDKQKSITKENDLNNMQSRFINDQCILNANDNTATLMDIRNDNALVVEFRQTENNNTWAIRNHAEINPNGKSFMMLTGCNFIDYSGFNGTTATIHQVDRTTGKVLGEVVNLKDHHIVKTRFTNDGSIYAAIVASNDYISRSGVMIPATPSDTSGALSKSYFLYVWNTAQGKLTCNPVKLNNHQSNAPRDILFNDNHEAIIFHRHLHFTGMEKIQLQTGATRIIDQSEASGYPEFVSVDAASKTFISMDTGSSRRITTFWQYEPDKSRPLWTVSSSTYASAISQDQRLVALVHGNNTYSEKSEVRIRELQTGKPLGTAAPFKGFISQVKFLKQSRILAIAETLRAHSLHYLQLIDVNTGFKLASYSFVNQVMDVHFVDSSDELLVITNDGVLHRFSLTPASGTCGTLMKLASVLTAKQLDESDSLVPLTKNLKNEYAAAVRQELPHQLKASTTNVVQWHEKALRKADNEAASLLHLQRLIDLQPDEPKHRRARADCYKKLEQHPQALADYTWLITHNPTDAPALLERCSLYLESFFNSKIEENPAEAVQYASLGLADLKQLLLLKKPDQARVDRIETICWDILLNHYPNAVQQEVARLLLQCIQYHQPLSRRTSIAIAYYRLGRYQEALEVLKKSKKDFVNQEWSYGVESLLCLGSSWHLPLHVAWGLDHPSDLLFQAMAEARLGRLDDAKATRRQLDALLLRPAYANWKLTAELDTLLAPANLKK